MVLRRLSKILHTSSATNPATLWLYSFPTLSDGRKWQRLAALDVGMREPLNRHPPLTKEPYNSRCIHLQHLSPSRLLRQVKRNPFKGGDQSTKAQCWDHTERGYGAHDHLSQPGRKRPLIGSDAGVVFHVCNIAYELTHTIFRL